MCIKCGSKRIVRVVGKCSDSCLIRIDDKENIGYVPNDMNIGGGDYIRFEYCLNCGQIQDSFPLNVVEAELSDFEEE